MKFLVLFLLLAGFMFGLDLLIAQIVVFGLAQFHVSSGILGPFLLEIAAVSVIGAGVMTGASRK